MKIIINGKWCMIALPHYLYDVQSPFSKGWDTSHKNFIIAPPKLDALIMNLCVVAKNP